MAVQLKSTQFIPETVYYPETDGKPMAESDLHRERMFTLIHSLQRFFAGQQVYVSGNLLIYYEQGNPRKSVAPDCFVVWGVEPHFRRIYKLWEEEKGPRVVFEVSSKNTQREDWGQKMRLYAGLGIEEYYIYDPTAEYLDPPLAAFRLVGGGYVPMEPVNEEVWLGDLAFVPGAGEPPEFASSLLGVRIALDEQNQLRLYHLLTGERLLTDEEARVQAEEQAAKAGIRADQAESRADQAEAENARLREELARLRGV
ncbi:MAG: Uma2 family endonuclease [Caldilineaceae bacterium]|nr:Uma2 family endonuclease [Caldilineaceae bacterium]HRJ40757.1 Uma2 family endonuclease [Caldilineaceae bacterium]